MTSLRSGSATNSKKEISPTGDNQNGKSGLVPVSTGDQQNTSLRQTLTLKPYQYFWSKFEPKFKEIGKNEKVVGTMDARGKNKVNLLEVHLWFQQSS